MPIYLPAPAHDPRGPDGQGWNRLSVSSGPMYAAQCALRPLTPSKLFESHNTPRAQWGGFGPCVRDGECRSCPIVTRRPWRLRAFTPRVLVRELQQPGHLEYHVMNDPDRGWDSGSVQWSLDVFATLDGWTYDRPHTDEHSRGFWLRAIRPPIAGVYGAPAPERGER